MSIWLDGAVRGAFTWVLEEQDAPAVQTAVERGATEPEQLRLLGPVRALPPRCGVPLLLSLRRSPHDRVSAAARAALRALSPAVVLPHVEAQIRAGDRLSDASILLLDAGDPPRGPCLSKMSMRHLRLATIISRFDR